MLLVRGASLLALRLGLPPLAVHRQVIRQEAPITIGAAVLLIVLGADGALGLFDSVLLLEPGAEWVAPGGWRAQRPHTCARPSLPGYPRQ